MNPNTPIAFKTRFTTTWILILMAILLIIWDVYARQYDSGTISEVMLSWTMSHPVVPFLLGVLGGHLCFPQIVVEKNDVEAKGE